MSGRSLRSGCSPSQRGDALPQRVEASEPGYNFLVTHAVPVTTFVLLGGILLMYVQNSTLSQGVVEIQSDIKSYLRSTKFEKEEKENVENKVEEITQVLLKLVVIISRLRQEIKEEMALRLDQGVVLSQQSYKEITMLMKSQLESYDSDKTGLTDYAMEMAGGKILSTKNTETYNPGAPVLSFFGVALCAQTNKAKAILQTSVMPGECWAVKGQQACAVIQLIANIYVTNVSLEHLPKSLSPTGEIYSAPNEFSIWGLTDENSNNDVHFFGQFVFKKDGPSLQTFEVQKPVSRTFKIVEFKLHSNHGHPDYTCIYRLRIHGKLSDSNRKKYPAI